MISTKQAGVAAARMAALRFFPTEDVARAEIARALIRFVETPAQLEWLVVAMIDQVGEWKGTRELRAVFCTQFKPLDGIEAWSEIPGFTAADSESQYAIAHTRIKELENDAHKRGPSDLRRFTQ